LDVVLNILVTGGSGYVGSKLVERLSKTNHYVTVFETQIFGNPIAHLASEKVRFIEGDIRDTEAMKTAMVRQDAVVHLAGVVTDELVDMNPKFGHDVNINGTRSVVEAAKWNGVKRLVYASSSSVYGVTAGEVNPDEGHTPVPMTEYAQQKLQGEDICFGMLDNDHTVTMVRQATAMGPAPRMRLDTVVNVFSKQAFFDGVITPYGGEQYRSNIHVDDAASMYIRLLEAESHEVQGHVWNWADESLKVKEIAWRVEEAAKLRGLNARTEVVDVKDDRSYRLNANKAFRLLDIKPQRGIAGAASDNFDFFAESGLDPTDPIYTNNLRMSEIVKRG
jgi:nucleoside-diphosphate-sugar epimerase